MSSPMQIKDSQSVVWNAKYHRSNKSPLCGLTPTPIPTQIRYSHYIFLSKVWKEEVSLIGLDHSGFSPSINVVSITAFECVSSCKKEHGIVLVNPFTGRDLLPYVSYTFWCFLLGIYISMGFLLFLWAIMWPIPVKK